MVLLLDDLASLHMKGIEDVKRFSVCERYFSLCGDPSLLTCIVTHYVHPAERRQNAREEIQDGAPPADQRVLATRWIEWSPQSGMIRPGNPGNVFGCKAIEVSLDGLLRVIFHFAGTAGMRDSIFFYRERLK